MSSVRFAALFLAVSAALLAGCGSSTGRTKAAGTHAATGGSPPPGNFLAVDARRHTVTITLVASYDGANGGFNFDGYSRELMWTVPRGWTVHAVCKNRGPLRHSCAVVKGSSSTRPAFRGASSPQPGIGLEAGHTATFSFRASRTGVYRFTCLVPGHELARMWDVLNVVSSGKPSAVDLLAR